MIRSEARVQAGTELAGRYVLEELLGDGGMGEVWRGTDRQLDRPVAVKVMRDRLAEPQLARRLQREARIAARLQHPGITVVHDVGTHDGQPFIVMELLRGRDLAARLKEAPELPVDTAISLAIQVAEALQAAHAGHVIHRDLKPANLFLEDNGLLKICDFGIARAADTTVGLTSTGMAIGTAWYMSPEQCEGRQVDKRSDLYSLGCVLYELLTGQPPFPEREPLTVMYQHRYTPPTGPRALRPDIPAELDTLVLDLLAKAPTDRPPDASAVAAMLRAVTRVSVSAPDQTTTSPQAVTPVANQKGPPSASAVAATLRAIQRTPAPLSPHATVPVPPPLPSHLTRILTGHTGVVLGVAFSPDGMLATASSDGTARLWDPATGDCLRTFAGHTEWVYGVAFSPDGRLLATAAGNDKTARLWDPATGDCLHTLIGHTKWVYGVAFSPDGMLATASSDGTARLWDPVSGHCLRALVGHSREVIGVAFSPDGRLLATAGDDRTARLWDPATGDCTRALVGHSGEVAGVAFSPDGRLLATASFDKTARLWDPATGDCLRILTGHTAWVISAAFSPDGRLLATAGRDDQTARVWDPATGDCLHTLTRHDGKVTAVAFSPDGRLLATAGDAGTRVWN